MNFRWDPKKAVANARKHGVTFREAATILRDPLSTTRRSESSEHGEQQERSVGSMKKTRRRASDELRKEYDFASMAGGVRGKYVERLAAGTNVVILDDDVAVAFPNDAAVNEALRALLRAAAVVRR